MNTVKRYDEPPGDHYGMLIARDGEYVSFDDYEKLKRERDELLPALKASVEPMEKLIRHFAGSLLEHKFNELRFVVRDIKQVIAKAEGGAE